MKQITLTFIFLSLLPGCALLETASTTTTKRSYGKHKTAYLHAHNAEAGNENNAETKLKQKQSDSSEFTSEDKSKQNSEQLTGQNSNTSNTEIIENAQASKTNTANNELAITDAVNKDKAAEADAAEIIAQQASESSTETTLTNNTINDDELFDEEAEGTDTFPGVNMDIWERIRKGFSMEEQQHKRIDQQLKWFARHQEYMDRVAERAQPYMHHIVEQLEANNIPLEIALLPIVESAFKPFAYSHGRASGIWQFIPATGKRYGLKQNWWYDGRRDVYASTEAAIKLLTALHKEFKGDWMLALAAYNSGGGNVRRAIRYNKKRGRPTGFFHLRLPKETKYYVPKLLALKELIAHPEKYNIKLKPISDEPFLQKVDLDSQIDLALAAELAEIKLDELYRLNPGFNRWATSPSGPHHLLVPLATAETFITNLADYPPEKRIRWIRHTIKKGETISTIARKYQISTDTIKRVNHIKGSRLRAGRGLTIPVASKKLSTYKLSANQRKSKQQNINRKGKKVTHIVQSGDTLWDLAQRHRVGVRQLAKWNSMAPRDPLVPGMSLVIWSRNNSAKADYHDPTHISAPPKRQVTQRIGYRVRNGDSLTRIANKFQVSVNQLLRWNKRVKKSKYLQPGQRIVLYVDVMKTSS